MDGNLKYLKVILPLKLDWEPCYSVLPGTEGGVPSVGTRVSVRFAGRQYVGVVSESDVTPDIELTKIQRIIRVEDSISPVTEAEMRLWRFAMMCKSWATRCLPRWFLLQPIRMKH